MPGSDIVARSAMGREPSLNTTCSPVTRLVATQRNGVEIVVQLRNGERRAIVQAIGAETYAPGDAVVLVSTGGRARISHAPMPAAAGAATVPAAPAAARAPAGIPVPAAYPDAPVQPVYPAGPVPPRT